MNDSDIEKLRQGIERKFHQWYERKSKKEYEEKKFSKTFNTTTLETHEYLVESFEDILGVSIGASTFRKLFYYKNKNFNKRTLKYFHDYIISDIIQKDNCIDEKIIKDEYDKWIKSLESPIINHHYFINQHLFRQIIVFALNNLNSINQKYINLLMINSIYYGDFSMHYLIDRCKNEQHLIQYLTNLMIFNWSRVSWRAGYILSKLNRLIVKTEIDKINRKKLELFDIDLIEHIINDNVENLLRNIIEGKYDMVSKIYAHEVLKQINYKITTANTGCI